jgi:hypothetical protein
VFAGWTRLIRSLALMTLIKNLGRHIYIVRHEGILFKILYTFLSILVDLKLYTFLILAEIDFYG